MSAQPQFRYHVRERRPPMEPHALPQPAPRLPPRVAAMVRWLVAHADEIDAKPYGSLVIDWGRGKVDYRLTRGESEKIEEGDW